MPSPFYADPEGRLSDAFGRLMAELTALPEGSQSREALRCAAERVQFAAYEGAGMGLSLPIVELVEIAALLERAGDSTASQAVHR